MIPPLWEHQELGVTLALPKDDYAWFFEMGCGKSRTAIELWLRKHRGKRTIVFCPPIVIPNWVNEWQIYGSQRATPLYGSSVQRLKSFNVNSQKGQSIFVTNYESLLMKPLLESFMSWKPQVLMFDESHRLKSTSAKRSKLAEDLANPFDKKSKEWLPKPATYLLSGSPVLNTPMDLFQQFKIMDGGLTFGRNFLRFRAHYFRDRNSNMPKDRHFPNWELANIAKDGFDAGLELNQRVFASAMRVEKKDCLDLPPEVSVTIKVDMTPTQRRLYDEMRRDLITFYESKACVASLAITKALRLLQITAGFVAVEGTDANDDFEVVSKPLADTPKTTALKELLEEICEAPRNKVLVWAVWKHNYQQIREVCEKLGLKFVEVHGGISSLGKREAVEQFNNDPSVRVFIGHPGSGGIGINLVSAGYSIFYSRNFSLEQWLQARARNHRGGSKEAGHDKITHYDLVCEGTIDELAQKKLASKQDMSDKLLSEIIQGL